MSAETHAIFDNRYVQWATAMMTVASLATVSACSGASSKHERPDPSSTPSATSSSEAPFTTLQAGDFGAAVAGLQHLLHNAGCNVDSDPLSPAAKIHGFGEQTFAAVKTFQLNIGLAPTGIADPSLQARIEASVGTNCGANSSASASVAPTSSGKVTSGSSASVSHSIANSDPALANPPAYKVRTISDEQAKGMLNVSWRPECLPISELRDVDVPYRDFYGKMQMGTIVIKASIADTVGKTFTEIYKTGYEINQIKPIEQIVPAGTQITDPNKGPEIDEMSMKADNTSGFNCRFLKGKADEHGLGLAIDVNPLENPMITPSHTGGPDTVDPVEGKPFVNTDTPNQAIITHKKPISDNVIKIFKKYRWVWGGDWTNPYDRQHIDARNFAGS